MGVLQNTFRRLAWVWRRIADLSTLAWVWPGVAAIAAAVLAIVQDQPLALLFVFALAASAFALVIVLLIEDYRKPATPHIAREQIDELPPRAKPEPLPKITMGPSIADGLRMGFGLEPSSPFLELKKAHHLLERRIGLAEAAIRKAENSYAEYHQHLENLRKGYAAKSADKTLLEINLADMKGALDGVQLSGAMGDLLRYPTMISSMGKEMTSPSPRPMLLIEHNQPFIRAHMENRGAIEEQLRVANQELVRMKDELEDLDRCATEEAKNG